MNALAYAIFALITILAFGLGGAAGFFFFRARNREALLDMEALDAELAQREAELRRLKFQVSSARVHTQGPAGAKDRLETEIERLRDELEQRDLDLNILRQDYDLETRILRQEIDQIRAMQDSESAGTRAELTKQQAELDRERVGRDEEKAELEKLRLALEEEKAGLERLRLAFGEEKAGVDEQVRKLDVERRLLAQQSEQIQTLEERMKAREAKMQDLQAQADARKEEAILIKRLRQQVQMQAEELRQLQELLARAEGELRKLAGERQAPRHAAGGPARGSSFPTFSPLSLLLDRPPSRATAAVEPPLESGDRLTEIRGIDERLQARLYALGITSFEQIARWSSADVRRIAERLGVDRRAIQEFWIGDAQARLFDRTHTL